MKILSENDKGETEAVFLSSENAVNIMTIHAAKGLEFPIVALYNTNNKSYNTDNFFVNPEYGISMQIPVKNEQTEQLEFVNTPSFLLSKINKKKMEDAEEKRILYVALTRAKEHLIISSTFSKKSDGGWGTYKGFIKLILNGLKISIDELFNNQTIKKINKLKIIKDNIIEELNLEYNIKNIAQIEKIEYSSQINESIQNIKEDEYLLDEAQINQISNNISASKILLYNQSQSEFINNYILGLHSIDDKYFDANIIDPEKIDDEFAGSLAGTLIHSVLEKISIWMDNNFIINELNLNELINNQIEAVQKPKNEKLIARIFKECKNIALTELIQKYNYNLRNANFEYLLTMPFKNNFLTAKFDLLIKSSDGNYEIWDWKTNRCSSKTDLERLAEYYKLQMQVYSYFLYLLYPEQEKYRLVLAFTRMAKPNAKNEDWLYVYEWCKAEILEFYNYIDEKIESINNII